MASATARGASPASQFDIADLRGALQLRWSSEQFRRMVTDRLRLMSASKAKKPAAGTAPCVAEPAGMTLLERSVAEVVAEIKTMLPPKPWHDTLRFVSFDLPVNDLHLLRWIHLLVDESENDGPCREGILSVAPAMRDHHDTAMFLKEIIFPFRSFLMAQVVSAVIQLQVDDGDGSLAKNPPGSRRPPSDAGAAKQPPAPDSRLQREIKRGTSANDALREAVITAAQAHAAAHAQNVDDVLFIDTLVPSKGKELRAHIKTQAKQGVCTRYAQYNLNYMADGLTFLADEAATDEAWLALMRPLAEAGLAHAQYDVGLCCLSGNREDEGAAWLERAAKLGHTRAMLELAKFHFADALQWTKTASARSKSGKSTSKGAAPSPQEVRQRTAAAMKWLDTLLDTDWDQDTGSDKQEARKLLTSLAQDAQRYKTFEATKKQELALSQKTVLGMLRGLALQFLQMFTLRRMAFACLVILLGLLISAPMAMPADGGRFKKEFSSSREADEEL